MLGKNLVRPCLFAIALSCALPSFSVCVNKYIFRTKDASKQVLTLLTGKLTFQDAQELAKSIDAKTASPLEWVDAHGKSIGKQFGELKVVRPMPVSCDEKTSGVVVTATFVTMSKPHGTIHVKLGNEVVVPFEQQTE